MRLSFLLILSVALLASAASAGPAKKSKASHPGKIFNSENIISQFP